MIDLEELDRDPLIFVVEKLIKLGTNLRKDPNSLRQLKLFLIKLDELAQNSQDDDLLYLNSYLSMTIDSFFFNMLTDVSAEIEPKKREALVVKLGKSLINLGRAISEKNKVKIYEAYRDIGKVWSLEMKNLSALSKQKLKPTYATSDGIIKPSETSLPLAAKKFNEFPATKHCENFCVSGIKSKYYKDFDFIALDAEIAKKDNISDYYNNLIKEIRTESDVNKLVFIEPKYGPVGPLLIANSLISKTGLDAIIVRHRRSLKMSQIKGELNEGDNLIIISDILTTGDSILKTLEIIKNAQKVLNIKDIKIEYVVVFFDRRQGALWRLHEKDLIVKSIFTSYDFKKKGLNEDYKVHLIAENLDEFISEEDELELKKFLGTEIFQKLKNF